MAGPNQPVGIQQGRSVRVGSPKSRFDKGSQLVSMVLVRRNS